VVNSFIFSYVPQRYGGESGDTYQTALKTGDTRFSVSIEVSAEAGVSDITFDLSELGIEPTFDTRVEGPFWGVTYFAEPILSIDALLEVGIVPDGLKTLRAIIRTADGGETTAKLEVYVDSTPPTMSISKMERSEVVLDAGSTVLISGDVDGTGTDTRFYEIWQREYDADGTLVRNFRSQGMPGTETFFALNSGPFSDVPLVLQSQTGNGALHPNAVAVSFSFLAVDEAGNQVLASTPIIPLEGEITPPEPLASNVLFLPGIKGSRLYGDDGNKLWISGGDNDIRQLFLSVAGKSMRNDVHVRAGDILAEVEVPLFPIRIYQKFVEEMNSLKSAGTIADWKPVPYDWRLSLPDLISQGAERDGKIYYNEATTTPYVEQSLRELAASSKTGKVTIVAHSNGGLVAKALMQKLGATETEALIDDVVFVGVPQLGAPQALAALLYGYEESLPVQAPLLASASVARELAENSPMTYHLLPTEQYFEDVFDTEHAVGRFAGERAYELEVAAYGETIDSWTELRDFVLAKEGGRTRPDTKNLRVASIGNETLLEYAESVHATIGAWEPPPSVTVHQVGGWGAKTFAGIMFREFSLPGLGVTQKIYSPVFVEDGDKTVPIPSALMIPSAHNVMRYWVNLEEIGKRTSKNYIHADLFEIDSILELINEVLIEDSADELPPNIYRLQPASNGGDRVLRFYLHSPLTLEVYDSVGNRVGPNEDGTYATEIDDSEYQLFGEVQFITVPAGQNYQVVLTGNDDGIFALEAQEFEGDEPINQITFAGIPTTPNTTAVLEVDGTLSGETILSVDIDGDGADDANLESQMGQAVLYLPPIEAGQEAEEDTTSGGATRTESYSEPKENSVTETIPSVATGSADQIKIQLAADKEPVVVAKEVLGEVLGATDSAEKSENSTQARSIDTAASKQNWLSNFLNGVYTLIVSLLEKFKSLFG